MAPSAIASGLIGGLVATVFLGWAINNARRVSADREGWSTLTPGAAIWAAILGSAAFSLLLFYVYFFVGSARADAEQQMMYCLALAIAFALGSLATACFAFSSTVSWRDAELRVRPIFGPPVLKRLTDLEAIEFRAWSSMFHLTFSDGYVVKVSPYMSGTRQLLEHIGHQPSDELDPPGRYTR
ncbi:hypothetical protein [Phenylobacterium sp.]|uniref:hypothetical protein n=1 Tax=Phenylobacterium sp. TaxID=1871053 RepID=UPI002ED7B78C